VPPGGQLGRAIERLPEDIAKQREARRPQAGGDEGGRDEPPGRHPRGARHERRHRAHHPDEAPDDDRLAITPTTAYVYGPSMAPMSLAIVSWLGSPSSAGTISATRTCRPWRDRRHDRPASRLELQRSQTEALADLNRRQAVVEHRANGLVDWLEPRAQCSRKRWRDGGEVLTTGRNSPDRHAQLLGERRLGEQPVGEGGRCMGSWPHLAAAGRVPRARTDQGSIRPRRIA
jgi:hypothetical protein